MVLVHMKNSPTDAEWEVYLDAITNPLESSRLRCMVITEGAHPTRAQQAALMALSKGKLIPVAVVSSATSVRFAVSVFALMNRGIKSYSPREYESGLRPRRPRSGAMRRRPRGHRPAASRTAPGESRERPIPDFVVHAGSHHPSLTPS